MFPLTTPSPFHSTKFEKNETQAKTIKIRNWRFKWLERGDSFSNELQLDKSKDRSLQEAKMTTVS
jgi:hypothetical protein